MYPEIHMRPLGVDCASRRYENLAQINRQRGKAIRRRSYFPLEASSVSQMDIPDF
jgi:hypothetical protein